MADEIVVVGGGVGGLATALGLGRAGHHVTLLERDVLAAEDDPESAFATERRGAPQAHQTHGLLARLALELRARFPDVLDELQAAGGTTMPLTRNLTDHKPGDEDLAVLILRRTTLEWALRRAARAEPTVEVRDGVAVAGLRIEDGTPPVVTGVRLADGSTIDADAVVVSTGRRGPLPAWLSEGGIELAEEVHETGLVYLTRWYRQPEGHIVELDPKIGGDLGHIKFLAVPADGNTSSITIAVGRSDDALRAALTDPDRFDRAVRLLPVSTVAEPAAKPTAAAEIEPYKPASVTTQARSSPRSSRPARRTPSSAGACSG